jgi:hypothetical protein
MEIRQSGHRLDLEGFLDAIRAAYRLAESLIVDDGTALGTDSLGY